MKQYAADTHTVLWYFADARRQLGRKALRALDATATGKSEVLVPVVVLWEVAILNDEGKIRLPAGFSAWCDALEAARGWRVEPLFRQDVEIARELRKLVEPHDRLIAATARRTGAPLLTRDERIAESGLVETVWN